MDKTIRLQKQVRENSEDFQNAIRDMGAWEEEMKRKDFEIRHAKEDQDLPPVRSKKKKPALPASDKSDGKKEQSKEKRIAGSDYKAWDKFDTDEACRKVEGKEVTKSKEELEFEIPSKEELEKEHAEASKYKDEGNALVQKKEYAKAVGKYSQAIKIFPHDAVFYANRALCQLKLDNLYAADADCTQAIKLDENYVKAYHRRATARMELKRYKEAKKDFERIMELEPSNKEAALKLKQVQEKIDKSSKPIIIAQGNHEESSIEKAIGKKLFGNKSVNTQSETRKSDKENKNNSVKVEEPQSSTSKKKFVIEEIDKTDNKVGIAKEKNKQSTNDEKPNDAQKEKTNDDELPAWLPKLKTGFSIVHPVTEAPRQSKKSLKRIEITEIADNESIFDGIVEEGLIGKKSIKESNIAPQNIKSESKKDGKSSDNPKTEETIVLPPPPVTSVGFFMSWRKSVSNDFRYKYLKQIVPKNLPSIIKASMESNVLSDIISVLNTKFVSNEDKVYDWLLYLSKLERFRALTLFLTPADRDALKSLLEYCKVKEGKTDDEVNKLHTAFEL